MKNPDIQGKYAKIPTLLGVELQKWGIELSVP
jgi:hypothetical protein